MIPKAIEPEENPIIINAMYVQRVKNIKKNNDYLGKLFAIITSNIDNPQARPSIPTIGPANLAIT